MSDFVQPQRRQHTRLLHPWDLPGKSTGVGCHCLLRMGNFPQIKWASLPEANSVAKFVETEAYRFFWKKSFIGTYWATEQYCVILCSPDIYKALLMLFWGRARTVLWNQPWVLSSYHSWILHECRSRQSKGKLSPLSTNMPRELYHTHSIPCTFCLFLSLYLLSKTFLIFTGLTFPILYLGLVLGVTLFLHHFSFWEEVEVETKNTC